MIPKGVFYMDMTKESFEAIVAAYNETCCGIVLDNNRLITIGYPSDHPESRVNHLSDIKIETLGGVDFMRIEHRNVRSQDGTPIEYFTLIPLYAIQSFTICETKDEQGYCLPDPIHLN